MNPNLSPNPKKGFLEILFEPSFSHFITPRVVGIIYLISVVLIGLATLAGIFGALSNLSTMGGSAFLIIILSPVGFLFYVILFRVMLESVVANIRSAEYLRILAEDKFRQP